MTKKKRSLGKGLAELIPEESKIELRENILTEVEYREKVINIDINQIVPNREQPRKEFDKKSLEALAKSIELHGIIQPIIVKPLESGYELIAGERRLRASKLSGKESIPCIVRDIEAILSAQIAIIENIQREDLNQIEEAKAYKNLITKYKLTQDELSIAVGKSRSYISNTLRLLKLDETVRDMIIKNLISGGHGKVLLSIDNKMLQKKTAKYIADKKLSVRETEKYIKNLTEKKEVKENSKICKNIHLKSFEEELISFFGTKVNVKDKNGKGKIEIEYYSLDDLERIKEILAESKKE